MKKLAKEIHEALEMHVEDAEDEEPSFDGKRGELDARQHVHREIVALGTDASGDMFFVDLRSRSLTNRAPVIRFHHDQSLLARVEANSLSEFLARQLIGRYQELNGPERALEKLAKRKTGLRRPVRD